MGDDVMLDYSWGKTYPVIWYRKLWWRWVPGHTIVVKKPEGWTKQDHLGNQMFSSLPEDHWGDWMRNNVGKQGWDWDWSWKDSGPNWTSPSKIIIKFRKGKERYAVEAGLKWA